MRLKLRCALLPVAAALLTAPGCGGLHSSRAAVQVYTLDPSMPETKGETAGGAATIMVLRPQAAPGLDTELIALRRSAQRLDYYADSSWPAPLPDVLQSLAIETLRGSGKFHGVQSDRAAFAAEEVLQIEIRRFQAEYAGDAAPVVHVQLLATLGRRNDRSVLATVSADRSVAASENRMQAVVTAFQGATAAALADLAEHLPP